MKLRSQQRPRTPHKRAEIVARQIINDIVAHGLSAGEALPTEEAMSAEYGVGRTSLRTALQMLEAHSIVHMKPGRGGGVTVGAASAQAFGRMATLYFQMTGATLRELLEARIEIEPMMCAAAARHATPEDRARLRELLESSERLDLKSDAEFFTMSSDFHGFVTSISGNRVLNLYGSSLDEIFRGHMQMALNPVETRDRVRACHYEIGVAILDGDAEQAMTLMERHHRDLLADLTRRLPGFLDETIDWL